MTGEFSPKTTQAETGATGWEILSDHTHDETLRPVSDTLRAEEESAEQPTVLDTLVDKGDLTYSA